ncbi:rhomboid family intramembrane serine protease [Gordonia sp. OPL2]|uniref:rhomboid family intramembrane serine protease n=1 Tax=Gordonia sp. OPL2 TaxID=2486274 RepID=UPI0016552385|nr:rhomboid family intramembrane serine protease [Gordonia sp. OPL2]ROZ98943.1 rhomboid family intramembrane serine protease [Gordonia sp. OPL2]
MCFRHPDRPTGLSCSRCGRPACPECLRPAAVGQHCVDCLRNDGVQKSAVRPTFGDRGISPMVAKPMVASRPYATYGLIAVNLVIFAFCALQARGFDMIRSQLFVDWALVKPWVADGEYWRLLTAGFLHFSVTHIALNMISLYILGRDLEIAIGIPRYLGVYLTALLGGSAAVMLLGSGTAINAGASGAIYGLMGAVLIVVLKARVSPVPVITIIVLNLVLSVTIPGISLLAHVGGLVFGAAATAGILFLPQWVLPTGRRNPAAASRVGWIAIGVLLILAVAIGIGVGISYGNTHVLVG